MATTTITNLTNHLRIDQDTEVQFWDKSKIVLTADAESEVMKITHRPVEGVVEFVEFTPIEFGEKDLTDSLSILTPYLPY